MSLTLEQAQALKPGDKVVVEDDTSVWEVVEVIERPDKVKVTVRSAFLESYFTEAHLSAVSLASDLPISIPLTVVEPAPEPSPAPEESVSEPEAVPAPAEEPVATEVPPEPAEIPSEPAEPAPEPISAAEDAALPAEVEPKFEEPEA
jgi:hypothetical protein